MLYRLSRQKGVRAKTSHESCSSPLVPLKVSDALPPDFGALSRGALRFNPVPMNALPPASLGRTHSSGGSVGNTSTSTALTSPTSTKGRKRRGRDGDSSPGSAEDGRDANRDRKRQPGVKRACNECRQQKVRPPLGRALLWMDIMLIGVSSASM